MMGCINFVRLPMGLSNSANVFQRILENVLRGLNWHICLVFIDDVIVFSPNFEQHLADLTTVFERFKAVKLKLKPSKCHFGQSSVKYLGHIVSKEGIKPDPGKCSCIQYYPVPKTVKQIRSFLGLANYYRRFIKDFSYKSSTSHQINKERH